MPLSNLSPQPLWSRFQELSAIPRPSGHEEAALQYLEQRLNDAGVENWRDSAGNLMMRKPATAGCEDSPGIVLQSHVDMVPQKADGVDHDFTTDGLDLIVDDGWVTAKGTTLGADNGIGVAAILAVMESSDLKHGPLEGLVTIDEERGLVGAQNLQRDVLQGKILLNLDSEDEGELFVGCAGGADLEAIFNFRYSKVPAGLAFYDLSISGLSGGHSGLDIHRGRGNAIQILAGFLGIQMKRLKLGLASLDGGTLLNAIPRNAKAVVAVPNRFAEEFEKAFGLFKTETSALYKTTDPHLELSVKRTPTPPETMMGTDFARTLLTVLRACPSQTTRMSPDADGVSETSNNLAVIKSGKNKVVVTCMARSLIKESQNDLVNRLIDLFELAGAETQKGVSFSGWTPDMESPVLQTAKTVYQDLFEKTPKINVIHAGLECGLLGEAYPDWDMISFGPTIKGAHSPDERVQIETVEAFWQFLSKMLSELA